MKILGKIINVIGWIIFIFALAITFLMMYGRYRPAVVSWYDNYRSQKYFEMLDRQQQELEDARKADVYGGETPEETIQLLIEALENGDIELAKKYYDVESRGGMITDDYSDSDVKKWINHLKEGLDNYNLICTNYDNCYLQWDSIRDETEEVVFNSQIIIFPIGSRVSNTISFLKNPHSNKWKILKN